MVTRCRECSAINSGELAHGSIRCKHCCSVNYFEVTDCLEEIVYEAFLRTGDTQQAIEVAEYLEPLLEERK